MKLLIVDDEETILETLELKLRKEGYTVFTATSAEGGMRLFKQVRPDLCLLDVMLPNRSGFDLCRAIRKDSTTPIIFLTARASEQDRIAGLELGADDYIPKPFNLSEVAARVKAVLRRTVSEAPQETLTSGNLRIDTRTYEVFLNDQLISFAPKEFALLHFLVRHNGQVFSREALLDRVWGAETFVNSRTVDVHIRWLREQIEEDPSHPSRLITVRGVGYKFVG